MYLNKRYKTNKIDIDMKWNSLNGFRITLKFKLQKKNWGQLWHFLSGLNHNFKLVYSKFFNI